MTLCDMDITLEQELLPLLARFALQQRWRTDFSSPPHLAVPRIRPIVRPRELSAHMPVLRPAFASAYHR